MSAANKRAVGVLPLFLYGFMALPLVYLPGHVNDLRTARYLVLVSLAIIGVSLYGVRQQVVQRVKRWPRPKKFMVLTLLGFMATTTLYTVARQHLVVLGTAPDYLGLVTWLVFLLLGVLFEDVIRKQLLSRWALYIWGVALVLSVVFDLFYIRNGIRIPGVMLQPTTLAMYANIAVVLGVYHSRKALITDRLAAWAVLLLALVVLGLCQSRIGNLMCMVTLVIGAYTALKQNRRLATILLSAAVLGVTAMPFISVTYFSRLQTASIDRGVSYRLELYKISTPDILRHNVLLGNGPGTWPTAINDPRRVPNDIAQTLNFGYKFNSTHNLFLDYGYFFGVGAALSLLALVGWSVWQYARSSNFEVAYLLIFAAVLVNALFNVPSLELTSLFFVVLFGLTARNQGQTS